MLDALTPSSMLSLETIRQSNEAVSRKGNVWDCYVLEEGNVPSDKSIKNTFIFSIMHVEAAL